MAYIQERRDLQGKLSYRVQIRLKGHPTQSATFERKTDAKKWASATESAIREGRHFKTTEAKRHTLAELIARYKREVLPSKAASTQLAQSIHLDWWDAKLGSYLLADITPALLSQHKSILATEPMPSPVRRGRPAQERPPTSSTRGPATVKRYLAALSHTFTIAVKEWGWLEHNPMERVSKPKEPGGRVRYLSLDELPRFLTACRASNWPELYPAALLALSTGARRMEIMTLRWRQVELHRQLIVLERTKNGDRRSLPLAGPALAEMQRLAKVRRIDSDLVFPNPRAPQQPIDLSNAFEAALKEAGISDFRWHDLRHTAASYLAMNGASPAEIAEVLGHKTLQMVMRYAHLSTGHVASVVARMNEAVLKEAT